MSFYPLPPCVSGQTHGIIVPEPQSLPKLVSARITPSSEHKKNLVWWICPISEISGHLACHSARNELKKRTSPVASPRSALERPRCPERGLGWPRALGKIGKPIGDGFGTPESSILVVFRLQNHEIRVGSPISHLQTAPNPPPTVPKWAKRRLDLGKNRENGRGWVWSTEITDFQ